MTLKSDRRFIIYIIMLGLVPISICFIISILGLIFAPEDIIEAFIIGLILFIVILVLFIALLKPKPFYEFNKNEIIINKKGIVQKIDINNISSMQYYKFKLLYLIPIFLPEVGCMKIHINDKENNKYELGFISYKNAKKVQEIYPEILKID